MNQEVAFRGFLFIGDPHGSSVRPGRRLDDFPRTVLGKLSQAAEIAHERSLIPVILGDLFHRSKENNIEFLHQLVGVLRSFPCIPYVLEGNHDKAEATLSNLDALNLLGLLGVVQVVATSGFVASFAFDGHVSHLWATPYGSPLPDRIAPREGINLMMTHHDLAFAGAYPGAALLKEIPGCDMVVNGHMHKTAPSVVKGQTTYHNPGNITRLSVDTIDHLPAVWEWTPSQGHTLLRHPLEHSRDVFDMTGLQVEAATPSEMKKALPRMMRLSQFAELLKAQDPLDAERSDDGAVMMEELQALMDESEAPLALRALLSAMAKEVLAEKAT